MTIDVAINFLDDTPDALIATTPEGRIIYWNQGAESTFGYSRAETAGKLLSDLLVPADRLGELVVLAGRDVVLGAGALRAEAWSPRRPSPA